MSIDSIWLDFSPAEDSFYGPQNYRITTNSVPFSKLSPSVGGHFIQGDGFETAFSHYFGDVDYDNSDEMLEADVRYYDFLAQLCSHVNSGIFSGFIQMDDVLYKYQAVSRSNIGVYDFGFTPEELESLRVELTSTYLDGLGNPKAKRFDYSKDTDDDCHYGRSGITFCGEPLLGDRWGKILENVSAEHEEGSDKFHKALFEAVRGSFDLEQDSLIAKATLLGSPLDFDSQLPASPNYTCYKAGI